MMNKFEHSQKPFEKDIPNTQRLTRNFFMRDSVVVAPNLLGKHFISTIDGKLTIGRIVETEAYPGDDPASHVYNRSVTKRTRVQYGQAGIAYVYGIRGYTLFSIVTGEEGVADLVFISAVEPLYGIDVMSQRRGDKQVSLDLTNGPAKLCKAFGISTILHGVDICSYESPVFTTEGHDHNVSYKCGPRINIGVSNAKELDKDISIKQPWRFYIPESIYLRRR